MTIIDICNEALVTHIGARAISSLTESSQEARVCNAAYDSCRRSVLRDHPWKFAEAREVLASVTLPDQYAEWDYAYAYPSDCLIIRKVTADGATSVTDEGIDYDTQLYTNPTTSVQSKIILAATDEAVLTYTKDVENSEFYDAQFSELLALRLASKIALPLTKRVQLRDALLQQYQFFLNRSKSVDTLEATVRKDDSDDAWIDDRFGS